MGLLVGLHVGSAPNLGPYPRARTRHAEYSHGRNQMRADCLQVDLGFRITGPSLI